MYDQKTICVVIPCFKVKNHIQEVISNIPSFVDAIIAVDDCCPEKSGEFIQKNIQDPRLSVLFHKQNLGVGGAVSSGYQEALRKKMDIIVKIDGDNQMDISLLPEFIAPLVSGKADYAKGNRFYWFDGLQDMPTLRLFGNSGLSFVNKLSSGYWEIMDPTNGYTAINAETLLHLPLDKIEKRYFFESDMLFRLGVLRAKVLDVPMKAKYQNEKSNLNPFHALVSFPGKYLSRACKRIIYIYFLRDFNVGSVLIVSGIPCLSFGLIFGGKKWIEAIKTGLPTPMGTLFIIALSLIFGIQFLLGFLIIDVQNSPSKKS